jgi:tRNA pseudouridine55 synthase
MDTGLLVLAVGSYTKKVPELTKQDKTYEAVMTLGATSTTDDAEGEIVPSSEFRVLSEAAQNQEPRTQNHVPTEEEVKEALQSFVGTIEQIPPQFSAIKIGGVKSYDAARRGETVTYEPRTVTIYEISNISYEYPRVTFTAKVGSGTYIRSLARDAGEKLGTGAYLSVLRRTSVGPFELGKAVATEGLTAEKIKSSLQTA